MGLPTTARDDPGAKNNTERSKTLAQREGRANLISLGFDFMFISSDTTQLSVQPLFSSSLRPQRMKKTATFHRNAGRFCSIGLGK
jgi:hypothetical protein